IPDFSSRIWYSESDPLLKRHDFFERTFGNDDSVILAIESKNKKFDIFKPTILRHIYEITEKAWEAPDVKRVESITHFDFINSTADDINVSPIVDENTNFSSLNIENIKKIIFNNKFVPNFLISENSKMALIHIQMTPSTVNKMDYQKFYGGIKKIVESYKSADINIYMSGSASLVSNIQGVITRDVTILFPVLLAFITILLWFLYRKISSVIIAYSVILTSILLMLGVQGLLGFSFNIISSISSQILLTVALADIIHLLSHIKFAQSKGVPGLKALSDSIYNNFYPTFLTSFTTAIGFAAFSTAKAMPISELGIVVCFGVLFAWISTYFLAAPLLVLLEKRKKVKFSVLTTKNEIIISDSVVKSIRGISKFKYIIVCTFIAILISGFYSMSKLVVDLDPTTQLPSDEPYQVAQSKLEKNFSHIIPIEIMIKSDGYESAKDPKFLRKVDVFTKQLLQLDFIGNTVSILDILKDLNQTFNGDKPNQYVLPETKEKVANLLLFYSMGLPLGRDLNNRISMNEKIIRLTAFWDIWNSSVCLKAIDDIHAMAKNLNLNAKVTGKAPMFHELTPYVVNTFFVSFGAAFILISLLMIFVLKDIKLGLLSLLPNIVPIGVGFLVYFLRGKSVDMTSVLIASVCFGIAVDDTIHFLFDYKRQKLKGVSTVRSLEKIFTFTLPSLCYTTLIIVCGFSSFLFASYLPNRDFGMMIAIILIFALITDALLLPALLLILDKDKSND
ncbi:MMPL family transporter, partial [Bacteriovoracaceae bacterium]|nr:MMPL family transporter [Bacteriovoracaceae bacterium]